MVLARIYILKSNQTDKVYVGSTTKTLNYRLSCHKCERVRYEAGLVKKRTKSHNITKYDDVRIELLEEFEAKDKGHILERERYYVKTTPNVCNKCIPLRDKKEWDKDNKEHRQNYAKQYSEKNADKIKKDWEEYYKKNSEKLKKRARDFYHNQKTLTHCDACDMDIVSSNYKRHCKSQRHIINSSKK